VIAALTAAVVAVGAMLVTPRASVCDVRSFAPGSGDGRSLQKPLLVHDAAALDAVRDCLDRHHLQVADILPNAPFVPIGLTAEASTGQCGSYDGGGHSIVDLRIFLPGIDGVGLFAAIEGGSVGDLTLLRPRVEHTVERDLRSARTITGWAARRWPVPHVLGFQSLVEEFATRIAEEMDFRLEAEYATEVRANFRDNPRVVIPEVMHEMTRRRVIVLEFIEGARVDRLAGASVDAPRLAGLVMEVYVQMMLVDGLFHADPHAGNLLLTRDGRLVLLDFGMMVRVPKELRLALIRTVFASIRRDAVAVAEGFNALGLVAPGADPEEITRLATILVDLSSQRTTTQQRLETMLSDKVMASLYDFPVILPRDLVYFARTAALIEGIGTRYDPYFNAIQVGTPLVMRMRSRILRSLGQAAEPSVEELAAMAGWVVGRAWRSVREALGPWLTPRADAHR
jgi:predicted unusual protein kinase regulating ubiquinone biosynthesis (AarF/ABC1/UbiB family)